MTILKKGHNLPIRQAQSPHVEEAPPPSYQDMLLLSAYCEDVPENPESPASGPLQPLLEGPFPEAEAAASRDVASATKVPEVDTATESASHFEDDFEARLDALSSSLVEGLASFLSVQADKISHLITAREATVTLYPTDELQEVYHAAKPKYDRALMLMSNALQHLDPSQPDTIHDASSCVKTLTETGVEIEVDAAKEVNLNAKYICEGGTPRERQIRANAYIEHKRKTSEIYGLSEKEDTEVPRVVALFEDKFPDEIETAELIASTFPDGKSWVPENTSLSNVAPSSMKSQPSL
jgi:hypothetical protein